jgi:hypothetical protein
LAINSFDPAVLANYYFAKLPLGPAGTFRRPQAAAPLPPWDISVKPPPQEKADVSARSKDPYFDPMDRRLFSNGAGSGNSGSQIEALMSKRLSTPGNADAAAGEDNHKLFALYQALYRLEYIAKMANREGSVDGQRPGLDAHFQDGLQQVMDFVSQANFNGLNMMSGAKSASTETSVIVPYAPYTYTGKGIVTHSGWSAAVPGVSSSDHMTVSITKAGVTTDVEVDFADVSGPLSLDNISALVNQKLTDAGFATRIKRVQTGGDIAKDTATWGLRVNNSSDETVSLGSADAAPAVYIAGTSGLAGGQQGRLVKLSDLSGAPKSVFSAAVAPESGTAEAKASVVDADGNVYVAGNTTGDFGNQLNQGSQDVFLSKYDSSGQVQWTRLLGAADTASGFALALDPTGGVVVAGSVKGDLKPTAIGGGSDSFVAKYDAHGDQTWLRQTAPVANDQALSVAVDASGNVYVGGDLSGTLGGSQISAGGKDAYVTKLSKSGTLLYNRQFGTAGSDAASKTAIASDGNLLVASTQNGRAIVTKYDGANGTSPALWQTDLGDLNGGAIGGLAVDGDQVYISGTTANAALTAGGQASIAEASNGGTEAFVFNLTDAGASASADFVSYVGTNVSEQGGGIAVAGGKIYLTGTTTGTFAGQTRTAEGTHNMFVAQLDASGTRDWTQQYGGRDADSKGFAIAADAQGASVLDALGLRRGKIDIRQSNTIESQTTARPGDKFTMKITDETGTRDVVITLSKGETLRSLAVKMNAHLLQDGKATAMPTTGGQKLKLAVNAGVQVELVAGPKDLDALAGLGLKEQVLVNDKKDGDDTTKKPAKNEPLFVGLGLTGKLDLLNKSDAAHARVVMQAAMALVKQAYGQVNKSPADAAAPITGNVPAYLQSQLANYQSALGIAAMGGFTRKV